MPQVSEEEAREIQKLIEGSSTLQIVTKANERQVGGSHYRDVAGSGEQHWDMMWRLYREVWFVGNVTKYILRYRKKDGIKDLKKCLHYLTKLIELEEAELEKEKTNDA